MAELSPAATAVRAAAIRAYWLYHPRQIAAALRTLADHQQALVTLGQPIDHWDPDDRTRRELRNLAAELEGTNDQ